MTTTRPELRGSFGMVASTHWLATAAGMATLEAGGNAFDAAVAAGFVLQVVEPHQNGPGGDLPAVVWAASRGEPLVLCGQGPAPACATIERYRSELGGGLVPGDGLLAAVVPGAFDGWMLMLRDFGTARLADVLRFAIGYAEDGFPAAPSLVEVIRGLEPRFRDEWPSSGAVYLPAPGAWGRLRNRGLAATYRRLLADAEGVSGREEQIEAARRIWREGFVGDAFARFSAANGGVLTGDDLAGWGATWEEPVGVDHGDLTVLKPGPWSQGPVFLQQLRLLEGFDLQSLGAAEYVHTLVECAKLAFADREAWYGDPAFVDVPLDALLSREYADERRRLVGDEAAEGLRPGSPEASSRGCPRRSPPRRAPAPAIRRAGRATPATSTSPTASGTSSPRRRAAGGSRARRSSRSSGSASGRGRRCSGSRRGSRRRSRPGSGRGRRSPTLVLRGGDPYLALGTPGGDQQDQWSLNVLLGHVHFGRDLQAAIDAPQFHTEAFPSSFFPRETRPRHVAVESRLDVAAELRERGHEVEVLGPWELGRVSAAGRDADGTLKAAADPRAQGYAAGR